MLQLTSASLVGFISPAGIASRNGILLIAHYLHLARYEGEGFTVQMIERAGKEILYPEATVIVGGLISSTLLDILVRPALFRVLGRKQAERQATDQDADLDTFCGTVARPLLQERRVVPPLCSRHGPHCRTAGRYLSPDSAGPRSSSPTRTRTAPEIPGKSGVFRFTRHRIRHRVCQLSMAP